MTPAIKPLARLALTSGLVAGFWLFPPTTAPGVEVFRLTGAAAAAEPNCIYLAQADEASADSPVSYATEQADRGEVRYKKACVECHGESLRGGLIGGPPLRGVEFEQKFADGAPASVLYGFMSSTMPPNAPGRYSASAYADLMAYILKQNGFKAGEPLPSDLDALDALIIEK